MNRVPVVAKIPVNATTLRVLRASLVTMATIAMSRVVTASKKRVSSKQGTVTTDVSMGGTVYSAYNNVLIQIVRHAISSPARALNANLPTTGSTVQSHVAVSARLKRAVTSSDATKKLASVVQINVKLVIIAKIVRSAATTRVELTLTTSDHVTFLPEGVNMIASLVGMETRATGNVLNNARKGHATEQDFV